MNKKYFHGSVQTAFLFCALISLGGCVSTEQKQAVLAWCDASELVDDLRLEFGVRQIHPDSLLRRIGEPDRRVPAKSLGNVLPGEWGIAELDFAIRMRQRQLQHLGMDSSIAGEEVRKSIFWLYDESARYAHQSQPASFFGMGTGFQLIWFAVDKDEQNVLVTGGFGLGNKRTMAEE